MKTNEKRRIIKKNLVFRKPRQEEFFRICRLLNRADKPYEKFIPDYEKFKVEDLNYMAKKRKRFFVVAEFEGKIVGFGAWSVKNKKICWLSILHIEPSKQRQGVGFKLLRAVETKCRKKDIRFLMCEIFPQAHWARDFYIKNGYRILPRAQYAGRLFKDIISPKTQTLVMIKKFTGRE